MIKFTNEELFTILYAVSGLLERTLTELETIAPDDDQKENFKTQLELCKSIIEKLKNN